MTDYLVFEENVLDSDRSYYAIIGTRDTGSAEQAIKETIAEKAEATEDTVQGRFWATPARSWRGLGVKTEVIVRSQALRLPGIDTEQTEPQAPVDPDPEPEPEPVAADGQRDVEF